MKRVSQAEVASHDHIQYWSIDCIMHQVQLCVHSGLLIADNTLKAIGKPYKYFGSLAKLTNTWRESHKASVTLHSWHMSKKREGGDGLR
jgi:hypothetical protein